MFGLAEGCLGSAVVAEAQGLVPVPRGVSWEGASTLPTAMLTALAALSCPSASQQGHRLLLPTATGAVGLAALQVRCAGALGCWLPI